MNRKYIKVNRDLTNIKINMLTALTKIEKNKRWYWICLCDCGNTSEIREDSFLRSKTISCWCFGSRNSIYRVNQKAPTISAHNSYYNSYKSSAKKRELNFSLSKEYFFKLTQQNCYYCNCEPRELCFNKTSHGIAKANGVDRINNTIGYISENCITCCKSCNIAKASMSQETFYDLIRDIYNNLFLGEK